MSSLTQRKPMAPLWGEIQAVFDQSSDSRKAVLGGLSGGTGGAVGTLAETGDVYVQLAITVVVTVVVVVCLLAAVSQFDRRADATA